jgi:hypothetical protein
MKYRTLLLQNDQGLIGTHVFDYVSKTWDQSVIPKLEEYIKIPNQVGPN